MSCRDCIHLTKPRWCSYAGEEVSHPSLGSCKHEKHTSDCDCDACEEKRQEEARREESEGCDWCGDPTDEGKKFCSKGCADAAQSDHA